MYLICAWLFHLGRTTYLDFTYCLNFVMAKSKMTKFVSAIFVEKVKLVISHSKLLNIQKWNFNIPLIVWVVSFPNYIESFLSAYSEISYGHKRNGAFLHFEQFTVWYDYVKSPIFNCKLLNFWTKTYKRPKDKESTAIICSIPEFGSHP